MLRQVSLGTLGLTIGAILTTIGFVAYAADNATVNLVGFFYGIPLLLGGLALKANELKPVPFTKPTTPEVAALQKQQATVTQNKIRKDLTRYCYGQNAHFERALSYLGLSPSEEKRPAITGLREEKINGSYALILEFDSPLIPLEVWKQKLETMINYFGPGVDVKVTQPEPEKIELALIATSQ